MSRTGAALVRAGALHIPLRDNSVDLIVTSPPYFALRSYRDDGEHYEGQIGGEKTPAAFLEALWGVTAECQPPGTLVSVVRSLGSLGHQRETEQVPIEGVRSGDRVVSYRIPTGYLHENGQLVERVGARPYHGEVVVAKAGVLSSRFTTDHHCVVRLADVDGSKFAVYMMKRGNSYRIGYTTLRSAQNRAWGPRRRASAEDADALWVLSLHDTAEEATLVEATTSYLFGVPMMGFISRPHRRQRPRESALGFVTYDQSVLDDFWLRVGDLTEKASACLTSFGRDLRYPLWTRGKATEATALAHRGTGALLVSKPLVIRACNLLDGMGMLCAPTGRDRDLEWVPITTSRFSYAGPVYSLEVENDHTYVADGILTHNCWRVLKPSGSMWVNLGDKYASAGGHTAVGATSQRAGRSNLGELVRGSEKVPEGFREKSLMGLPWRYVIGCIDGLAAPRRARRCVLHAVMSCPLCCEDERQQWILRAEVVWSKPTGLPEHAVDRVRRSHEHWFHLTKEPTYFSNIDEIREPLGEWAERARQRDDAGDGGRGKRGLPGYEDINRSAWQEGNPLGKLPGSVWEVAIEPLSVPEWVGVDHFAAFPQEWPRRLILGWSPMPGVVLDPFVGTGTTVGVARALGRFGVGVDLSADYLRLARWRVWDSGHFSKTVTRTNQERQGSLL